MRREHIRGAEMKIVQFYETDSEGLAKAATHLPAHRARLGEFHARGVLLMAGPLGTPPTGALGVFSSRKAAEEFIQGDPFVQNGVVRAWRLVEWHEVLA